MTDVEEQRLPRAREVEPHWSRSWLLCIFGAGCCDGDKIEGPRNSYLHDRSIAAIIAALVAIVIASMVHGSITSIVITSMPHAWTIIWSACFGALTVGAFYLSSQVVGRTWCVFSSLTSIGHVVELLTMSHADIVDAADAEPRVRRTTAPGIMVLGMAHHMMPVGTVGAHFKYGCTACTVLCNIVDAIIWYIRTGDKAAAAWSSGAVIIPFISGAIVVEIFRLVERGGLVGRKKEVRVADASALVPPTVTSPEGRAAVSPPNSPPPYHQSLPGLPASPGRMSSPRPKGTAPQGFVPVRSLDSRTHNYPGRAVTARALQAEDRLDMLLPPLVTLPKTPRGKRGAGSSSSSPRHKGPREIPTPPDPPPTPPSSSLERSAHTARSPFRVQVSPRLFNASRAGLGSATSSTADLGQQDLGLGEFRGMSPGWSPEGRGASDSFDCSEGRDGHAPLPLSQLSSTDVVSAAPKPSTNALLYDQLPGRIEWSAPDEAPPPPLPAGGALALALTHTHTRTLTLTLTLTLSPSPSPAPTPSPSRWQVAASGGRAGNGVWRSTSGGATRGGLEERPAACALLEESPTCHLHHVTSRGAHQG